MNPIKSGKLIPALATSKYQFFTQLNQHLISLAGSGGILNLCFERKTKSPPHLSLIKNSNPIHLPVFQKN